MTSVIQPMDKGVIKNLKHFYRRFLVENILTGDSEALKIKLDVLQASRLCKKAWDQVTSETIKHCFKKAGFVKKEEDEENADDIIAETMPSVDGWEDVISNPTISYDDFLNVDDDVAVCGEITDADIIAEVLNHNIEKQDGDEASGDEDESSVAGEMNVPSAAEATNYIMQLRRFFESKNDIYCGLSRDHGTMVKKGVVSRGGDGPPPPYHHGWPVHHGSHCQALRCHQVGAGQPPVAVHVVQAMIIMSQKVETLSAGEIFSPPSIKSSDNFTSARFRTPTRPARFLLLETPYIQFLRDCLDKSLNRPDTAFNKEQHTVMFSIMERVLVPLLVHDQLIANHQRACGRISTNEKLRVNDDDLGQEVKKKVFSTPSRCARSSPVENYHSTKTAPITPYPPNHTIRQDSTASPQQSHKIGDSQKTRAELCSSPSDQDDVQTFCCVDKKGILSWPNPTPEKVFFLKALSTPGEDKPSDQMDQVKKSPRLPSGARSPKHISGDVPRNNNMTTTSNLFETVVEPSCNGMVWYRCLCELATQIGFTDKAVGTYRFQQQVGLFRHVNLPGTHQIFSQGTADLVLDACSEYWNGRDIRSLSESDRKKILDFYQRSSLTAHCMAFSYGPLISPVDRHLTQGYLELPPDSSHIFPSLRSLNSISSESLLQQLGSTPEQGTVDVDGALRLLGHEVFIGMVTMQYQACPISDRVEENVWWQDIVCLVEQLDNACIRFVHFSKENELRSRVFSEKMGLESGWNCHISLLSEKVVPESEPSIHQVATLSTSPAAHCKASSSQVLTTLVPSHILKAKLPKGIRAIRPHLVSVDNVPLLVSLFTDCTPDTTREMVAIMQEHGRVVCCMGSSANPANGPVFLQADASTRVCVVQSMIIMLGTEVGNHCWWFQNLFYFLGCFCLKFIPSICIALFCFILASANFCPLSRSYVPPACQIFVDVGDNLPGDTMGPGLTLSQHLFALILTFYFGPTSEKLCIIEASLITKILDKCGIEYKLEETVQSKKRTRGSQDDSRSPTRSERNLKTPRMDIDEQSPVTGVSQQMNAAHPPQDDEENNDNDGPWTTVTNVKKTRIPPVIAENVQIGNFFAKN
ncbi:KIAA0195 [Cordylochernes scorpioides]|uniref:KIAA0195 n=1 Tax=Cordylochernes scorpioides TaxID=51811 RepID=A0ABY6LM39_9ARAC|nr:KIAA0195 [Cordylochernes scorpioides]